MNLPIRTIVILIMAVAVLLTIAAMFLFFTRPSEDSLTFQMGCRVYCGEIEDKATASDYDKIIEISVIKAEELQGSEFMASCERLFKVDYPWECWSKNCCHWGR
jgi:hypothetical protein